MGHVKTRGGPEKIANILKSAGYDPSSRSNGHVTGFESFSTAPTNYVGTALFLGYIAAALLLTFFILWKDIIPRWTLQKHGISTKSWLLSVLAATSFSILSFNMISFLLESYLTFLAETNSSASARQIWPWMLNSHLFYSFASDLLVDDNVVAWTRQGLFTAMIVGMEMSCIGREHKVKYLWMYFCLGQILPPTFAFYLLQLRASLPVPGGSRSSSEGSQPSSASNTQGWRGVLAFLILLLLTAISLSTLKVVHLGSSSWDLLANVLCLRSLLFVPLFLDVRAVWNTVGLRFLLSQQHIVASALLLYQRSRNDPTSVLGDVWGFVGAGFRNPAIRTLSCDWILKGLGGILLETS